MLGRFNARSSRSLAGSVASLQKKTLSLRESLSFEAYESNFRGPTLPDYMATAGLAGPPGPESVSISGAPASSQLIVTF